MEVKIDIQTGEKNAFTHYPSTVKVKVSGDPGDLQRFLGEFVLSLEKLLVSYDEFLRKNYYRKK